MAIGQGTIDHLEFREKDGEPLAVLGFRSGSNPKQVADVAAQMTALGFQGKILHHDDQPLILVSGFPNENIFRGILAQEGLLEASSDKQADAREMFKKEAAKGKSARTKGQKITDWLIYGVVTNTTVFAFSVAATYLTSHGDKIGGATGRFMKKRGDWFAKTSKKLFGISEEWAADEKEWNTNRQSYKKQHGSYEEYQAYAKKIDDRIDMAKTVAFSYLDGTLLAPVTAYLETKRNKIAKSIDKMLGTIPEDQSVYEDELKRDWKSVVKGRLATASIVVPVAIALDKTQINIKNGKSNLNNILFRNPGTKIGEWIESKSEKAKNSRLDIPDLFKIVSFEAFYTTVCTVGLKIMSGVFAKLKSKKDNPVQDADNHGQHKIAHSDITDFSVQDKTLHHGVAALEERTESAQQWADKNTGSSRGLPAQRQAKSSRERVEAQRSSAATEQHAL